MAWCTKVRLVTSFFVPGELLLFLIQAIAVWLSDCKRDGGDGFHKQSCFFSSCDNGQLHGGKLVAKGERDFGQVRPLRLSTNVR